MDVLLVERILEELDDVVANGVLGSKALRPCEELAGVDGCLLDGETAQGQYYPVESKAPGV